jgi:hypothetical protein
MMYVKQQASQPLCSGSIVCACYKVHVLTISYSNYNSTGLCSILSRQYPCQWHNTLQGGAAVPTQMAACVISNTPSLIAHLYGEVQARIALVVPLQLRVHGTDGLLHLTNLNLTRLNLQQQYQKRMPVCNLV